MPDARYFLPDHPDLTGDYSRDDLRFLLQTGKLSRSDMVLDDQTGLAHLVGALLASPYHLSPIRRKPLPSADEQDDSPAPPNVLRSDSELDPLDEDQESPAEEEIPDETEGELEEQPEFPRETRHAEFRAATPLRQREFEVPGIDHDGMEEDAEDEEYFDDGEADEEEEEDDENHVIHQEAAAPLRAVVRDPPKDEELILHGHPAWLSYRKSLFSFLILASVSILAQEFHFGLAWCVTAAALALLCLAFVALDRMTTEYLLTTRRVEIISGLIGRSSKEIRVADIRAVDVTQTGLNALFAVGTVDFYSSAGDEADVCFENISRPHRLKEIVRDLQG